MFNSLPLNDSNQLNSASGNGTIEIMEMTRLLTSISQFLSLTRFNYMETCQNLQPPSKGIFSWKLSSALRTNRNLVIITGQSLHAKTRKWVVINHMRSKISKGLGTRQRKYGRPWIQIAITFYINLQRDTGGIQGRGYRLLITINAFQILLINGMLNALYSVAQSFYTRELANISHVFRSRRIMYALNDNPMVIVWLSTWLHFKVVLKILKTSW